MDNSSFSLPANTPSGEAGATTEELAEGEDTFEEDLEDEELAFTEPLNKGDLLGDHNNPIYAQIDFKKRRKSTARYV